jgi:hypothetical protein
LLLYENSTWKDFVAGAMIRQNDVLEHQMLQQLFPLLAGDASS